MTTTVVQTRPNRTGNDRSHDHCGDWLFNIVGTIIHWMVMIVEEDLYVFFHEEHDEMTLPFMSKIFAYDQWERFLSFRCQRRRYLF
jgi:hypothetical protein